MPPGRKVAVVVCMDARIDPARALGLEEGDAHVIRNAGGRAEDAIRSLAISQELLGTREIVVIHHTDCGMLTFSNDDIRQKLGASNGPDCAKVAGEIDFLPFPDVEHERPRRCGGDQGLASAAQGCPGERLRLRGRNRPHPPCGLTSERSLVRGQ